MKDQLEVLRKNYKYDFQGVELLREGGCTTYCVRTATCKYFLKVISQAFLDSAKPSLEIQYFLQEHGVLVPEIIRTIDDKLYVSVNGNENSIMVLYRFLEGRELESGEGTIAIGELVGKMHVTMKSYNGMIMIHDKEYFIDRYIRILEEKKYDTSKIEQFRLHGEQLWSRVKNLPRGFCHGDLYYGNVWRVDDEKYCLLDFDTASIGFSMYDLVLFCNETDYFSFKEDGYEKSKMRFMEFAQGYSQYINLTEQEEEAFFDMIAIYHYQLQATIIEVHGLDCVDEEFLDGQLDWLMRWERQCNMNRKKER